MKFSVNWLREFVQLPDDIGELADLLTMAGVEIEAVEQRGAKIDKVVVARILASSQHPNADRLSVCEVEDGTGTKRQIVCGAKNYKVGDKVPLAVPGAKLPNGTEIRKSKLRGVESEGMLCSAIELGLGQDAAGLLILSPEAKIGAPISDLFPSDTIFDVEITPNRGDLLSHYGLAREIAALTGRTLKQTRPNSPPRLAGAKSGQISIATPDECPFFSLRRIENVKIGPSPQWLRAKIESVGIRSINNVVDASNFVMLELGQPSHAFDADKLKGALNVRMARAGEKILALDGKTYSLKPNHVIVADQERAVGIGGVMGGEETGVSESTKTILLEAAYFLPASVRHTARELNLPTDASYRFERGVDSAMVLRASERVAELISEIAGGKPGEMETGGTIPADPANVLLAYGKCSRVLGVDVPSGQVDHFLTGFGLTKEKSDGNKNASAWQVPTYRRDLQRDVDLIEEVARAYGVEKIPGSHRSRVTPASDADRADDVESSWRQRLVGAGLTEVRTSKLLPREKFAFGQTALELRNPLSEDHVALRPSILSGLLGVLDRNIRAGADRVAIFEIGRTFVPPQGKEERHIGILIWGNPSSAANWRAQTKRTLDLFDLKGALESVVSDPSFRAGKVSDLALPIDVYSGAQMVGFGGQVSSAAAKATGPVFVAELHADLLIAAEQVTKKFHELERYPSVSRDIAMIVPEKLSHAEILRVIENPREPLLQGVELFDLFTSNVGESRKSLAYRLTYRDRSRTLTSEEVTVAHAKIRERLQRELGAELRE